LFFLHPRSTRQSLENILQAAYEPVMRHSSRGARKITSFKDPVTLGKNGFCSLAARVASSVAKGGGLCLQRLRTSFVDKLAFQVNRG
jgi:hypothetical protein